MKLTIVAGARPNFMKVAPIIHAIHRQQDSGVEISFRLIHTGQHYDALMSGAFFDQLNIPLPDHNLEAGGGSQAVQTAAIMAKFEMELLSNVPDYVIVVGDVTSTMACTLAAVKLNIKVAHVEAGIRSFDRAMPEEVNRIVVDSICDLYYTTTEELLKSEVLNSIVATAILVKGARKYQLESVVEVLKERLHKTSLEINLEAIKHNFRFFRKSIASETKLMCMVKAFGYGSGTFEVSKTLQEMNVDYLGVAFADEGVALREAGIEVPIMVMNTDAQTMDILHQFNLEPVVYSLSNLQSYISCLEGRNGSIHLELDTGMHRLGFAPSELLHAVDSIPKNIKVKSIFSHLAVSENPEFDDFTRNQARVFFEFAGKTESILGYSVLKHISNTGGIERFPEIQGNMVRLGIGLYGLQPDGTEIKELQTVASLFSTVTQIHDVQANEGIGYGLHDHEPYKRRIATIAMGYADGLSRRYGKKVGSVMINGNEVPFVGNICMDMAMVDVTDIQCNEGDRVEIFGEQLSINKMARRGGTISYEILTGISQRVPRIYLGDN